MSRRGEAKRTELKMEKAEEQRSQQGRGRSQGTSIGRFVFPPTVPLADFFLFFFKALCLESHIISLMTSSPGVVHASVPCPHSTVCFLCCLGGDTVGNLGVGAYVCEVSVLKRSWSSR